ncbi:MAG: MerR family transcriptional regulator [Bdellovibrio sp. CG12_big_fil_rev_8_21_14_0_65_39_13]|nr:MAG: MerR family transcriptional regulator [Bdellovibrio sp. CG22_combo_CG10-13_8_21_14_all_39_27]PIQ58540.1 MAG: MerR family transcriptional regulator [Bdellovibrio sp. CG12_big_fil_rev_8_21_14_0_65_39_13]PIR34151.1 MAG: MerR family transcriptional regulator [Bdellovibrio sp. CG11_big_fil_rev_8_21_14_0_20_39_38]
MDIGVVSKKSGISTSTLRYYEEKGLIGSTGRVGLRRQYHSNVLQKLALITLAKQAGFSLDELNQLFKNQKKILLDKSHLKKKAMEIDKKIKRLEAVRDGLIHAGNCKAPSHLECPTFQRLLSLATKKQLKTHKK